MTKIRASWYVGQVLNNLEEGDSCDGDDMQEVERGMYFTSHGIESIVR